MESSTATEITGGTIMAHIRINELGMTYPDSFHEMSEEEKAGLNFYKDSPGVCLADPEHHIIVTVGWMKSGITAMMINEKEAARTAEKKVSKPMAAHGYHLEGFSDAVIGEVKASGYRYHYCIQDTEMTGETLVVKYKKVFYYLNFYARTGLLEESIKIWQTMLDTIVFEE